MNCCLLASPPPDWVRIIIRQSNRKCEASGQQWENNMLLSEFVAVLEGALADTGDTVLKIECISPDAGILLVDVDGINFYHGSSSIHVLVSGKE